MRVALAGGSYKARSLIADAVRTINLYPEKNPPDAPFPFTYYPTPGLTLLATPTSGAGRGLYTATDGSLYAVVGSNVYYVDQTWTHNLLGTIQGNITPVSMSDNGLVLVLVDGSSEGYSITLSGQAWNGAISDPAFYGADKADFVDTFFLFNRPGTAQFYVSPSNWVPGAPFNPLYIASKTGNPDPIQALICMHAEPWFLGTQTSEVWYDAGAADFPFQRMPGVYIEHGCVAKYSVAKEDLSIFWLSQDRQGQCMVLEGTGYAARRVSNHALEAELSKYGTVSDAIGFTYQQQGHVFYFLTFPTANATWVYDVTASALAGEAMWHQRGYTTPDGVLNRHRACSVANAYGKLVCQDWQTGQLYQLDQNAFTDNGAPIQRTQSFPHLRDESNRVVYAAFTVDMETGTAVTTEPPTPDPSTNLVFYTNDGHDIEWDLSGGNILTWYGGRPYEAQVSLRWSDDGGYSWGNPVMRGLGKTGAYATYPIWRRTGIARKRVFEVSWSVPYETALNGAYIEVEPAAT